MSINKLKSVIKASEHKLDAINAEHATVAWDSKFMPYGIRVIGHMPGLPSEAIRTVETTDGTMQIEVIKSALCAKADKHMVESGNPEEYYTITRRDGDIRVKKSCISAVQIVKGLEDIPGMDINATSEAIYQAADKVRGMNAFVIGRVKDMLLVINKRRNLFSDDYLAMSARLKAPTLRTEAGAPAITDAMCQMVDTYKGRSFTTDKSLKAKVDGAIWMMKSGMVPFIPVEFMGVVSDITKNTKISLGGRCINNNTAESTELGKTNVILLCDADYKIRFKACTGRAWTENDPMVIIPSVTMKSFAGPGVRSMSFQWLSGAWVTNRLFTKERVSIGEHVSSWYLTSTEEAIANVFVAQAKEMSTILSDAKICREWLANTSEDELSRILDSDDEQDAQLSMSLKKAVDNARTIVAEKLPTHRVANELVLFFLKSVTSTMSLRDNVMTLKVQGEPDDVMTKHIKMPSTLIVPNDMMECNLPACVRAYTRTLETYSVVDLKSAVKANGWIVFKRTPVVNGKFIANFDDIEWENNSNVVSFSKEILYLLTADNDGDFIKFSFDYPVEHVDFAAWASKLHSMERKVIEAMDSVANLDPEIPSYEGQKDALGDIKELIKKLDAKYPNAKVGNIVRELYVKPLVGPATNAANDCIHSTRSLLMSKGEEGRLFIGALGRVMSEGFIQLIKHPEGRLTMDAQSLRRNYWKVLNCVFGKVVDEYAVDVYSDERTMRKGMHIDSISIPTDWKVIGDEQSQANCIKAAIAYVREERANNKGRFNGALRTLTVTEQLAYLKCIEMVSRGSVMSIFHKGLDVLNVNMAWVAERNPVADAEIVIAMKAVIIADAQTTDYTTQKAMFYGLYEDGSINWNTGVVQTECGQGVNRAGDFGKEYQGSNRPGNIIVDDARTVRSIAPSFLLLANLYNDAIGKKVGSITRDSFTAAEMRITRTLIEVANGHDDMTYTFTDKEASITKHGEFVVFEATAKERWNNLANICIADGVAANKKELSRVISKSWTKENTATLSNGYAVTITSHKE